MSSFIQLLASLLLLQVFYPLGVAAQDAWHLDMSTTLVREELDPIVSPNVQSAHMHRVIGGSGFKAAYNFDDARAAACTSVALTVDKSNYWMPQLYWYDNNTSDGSTEFVPLTSNFRFYYFLAREGNNIPVTAFPPGFRMLTGNPNNKNLDSLAYFSSYQCQVQSDFQNTLTQKDFNFPRDCPWGMKTTIRFPSCWDGKTLYSTDGSHVAWPDMDAYRGTCPRTHPIRIPSIMLEYTWQTQLYSPGTPLAGHLVWANGDTTGGGMHADFTNGWDIGILQTALNTTGCTSTTGTIDMPIQNCPVFAPYWDPTSASACTKPDAGVLTESFGNADLVPIPRLPGCNPLWGNTPNKPGCSPAVPGLSVSGLTGTQAGTMLPQSEWVTRYDFPNVTATGTGWQPWQCLASDLTYEPFTNSSGFADSAMTVERCTSSCQTSGLPWAALTWTGVNFACYCASGVTDNAMIRPDQCTSPCPGNSSEICGGQNAFSTYVWGGGSGSNIPNITTGSTSSSGNFTQGYVGCYQPPGSGPSLIDHQFYNYSDYGMTNEVCATTCVDLGATWSATRYYYQCFCGKDYNIEQGLYKPNSFCTLPCKGNSSEVCGDISTYSVTDLTKSGITPSSTEHPAGWIGCYVDNNSLLSNQLVSGSMTVEFCVNSCAEMNYTMAGVENGYVCRCGNSFTGTQWLPSSSCQKPCNGNSSETCGGSQNIELYNTTAATVTMQSVYAAHPAGWLGCFSNSNPQNGAYSWSSNSMTVESCQAGCSQFNYTYSWVSSGNKCACDNVRPTGAQQPASTYCKRSCAGNATETCGDAAQYELYSTAPAVVQTNAGASGYLGCYTEAAFNVSGSSYGMTYSQMSIDFCQTACKEMGYPYMGVETGGHCYCSYTPAASSGVMPYSSCSAACPGNSTQNCGGTGLLSVYTTQAGASPAPMPTQWLGCYNDPTGALLTSYTYSSNFMTSGSCRKACGLQGYTYAATENGNICNCGNSYTGAQQYPRNMCNVPCAGNSTEMCGAVNIMDVYLAANATVVTGPATNSTKTSPGSPITGYMGCFSDIFAVNSQGFTNSYMTPDSCIRKCQMGGWTYASLYNGNHCGCGNSTAVKLVDNTACSSACAGDTISGETCGGPNAAAVYTIGSSNALTAGSSSNLPATRANGWIGCFVEGNTRILPDYMLSMKTNTPSVCGQTCRQFGYSYAGVEYGSQCFCGNAVNGTNNGAGGLQVADSICNQACAGDPSQSCGNSGRVGLYEVDKMNLPPPTGPTIGQDGYVGCYQQNKFNTLVIPVNPMDPNLCRRVCLNRGYDTTAIGAGYCLCGQGTSLLGMTLPQLQCNVNCTGDNSQVCGGSNGIVSVYSTTGVTFTPPANAPKGYVGCFQDLVSPRALSGYSVSTSTMTGSGCMSICKARGYTLAGTENGQQCFCGNSISTNQAPDSKCSMPCSGNSAEMCGTGGALSLYNITLASLPSSGASTANATGATTSNSVSSTASVNATSTTVASSGTASKANITSSVTTASIKSAAGATSSVTSRASSTNITASTSASASKTSIASSVTSSKTSLVASGFTSSKTSAASAVISSKSSTVSPVTSSKTSSVSAVTSSKTVVTTSVTSTRATTAAATNSTTVNSMSSQPNRIASNSATSSSPSVKPVSSSSSATSVKPASSSASSSVAPSSTSTLSKTSAASSSSSSTTTSSTIRTTTSSSTSSASPIPTPGTASSLLKAENLVGCFVDSTSSPLLANAQMSCDTLTVGMCRVFCQASGYSLAAVKNGNICSCGMSTQGLATSSQCNVACKGDGTTNCGGTNVYSVYSTSTSTSTSTTSKRAGAGTDEGFSHARGLPRAGPQGRAAWTNFRAIRRPRTVRANA